MARIARLGSLGITFVLLSVLNTYAQPRRPQGSPGDFLPRLFERADARHRRSRRNLEAILRDQPQFWRELHAVAGRLGTDPAWLLNVMACESLFDPDARNSLPGQTASGLLQIIERTARRLGTTAEAIRGMSPVDQLRLVERYLEPFKGRLKALPDVYMAVLRGSVVEGGAEVVVVDSSKEPRVYGLNKSLDVNGDGRITKGELGLVALSVGRFLPAQSPQRSKKNDSSGKTVFMRGEGNRSQAHVERSGSPVPAGADRPPQTLSPTRSIYIRNQ